MNEYSRVFTPLGRKRKEWEERRMQARYAGQEADVEVRRYGGSGLKRLE